MRNRRNARVTARAGSLLAALIVWCASGTVASARDESLAVFLNLPEIKGFSDATHALVEAKELLRGPLSADPELRLVDRPEDADAVLTVLGRGRGDAELTAALRNISPGIVAPPVPIAGTERYIEILLTTGPCRTRALTIHEDSSDSCYRRIFVGVGFGDLGERRPAGRPRSNSWEACAASAIRDIRAWLTTNATRLRTLRVNAQR